MSAFYESCEEFRIPSDADLAEDEEARREQELDWRDDLYVPYRHRLARVNLKDAA